MGGCGGAKFGPNDEKNFQMPNFCPFYSSMSRFWVASQFWMTPNYIDMFKIKSIYMHTTYTPEAQFTSISLYDEPL